MRLWHYKNKDRIKRKNLERNRKRIKKLKKKFRIKIWKEILTKKMFKKSNLIIWLRFLWYKILNNKMIKLMNLNISKNCKQMFTNKT